MPPSEYCLVCNIMFCLTSNNLNGYLYFIDGKILWMSQRTSIYVRKLMTWPILDIETWFLQCDKIKSPIPPLQYAL